MNRRAAIAFVASLLATPALPGCLFFCSSPDLGPDAARTAFADVLGAPLPDGVQIVGMIDGGFQDHFIQVRLSATPGGAKALLALLNVAPIRMRDAVVSAPDTAPWWDPGSYPEMLQGDGQIAGFTSCVVGMAADRNAPGRTAIFLFAFQT